MNQEQNPLHSPLIRLMCWLALTVFALLELQQVLRLFPTAVTRIPYRLGLEVAMLVFVHYFLPRTPLTQRMQDLVLLALAYKLTFLCAAFFSEDLYLWIYLNAERPVMTCLCVLGLVIVSWPDTLPFTPLGIYSYRFGDRLCWATLLLPTAAVIGLRTDSLPPQWWIFATAMGGLSVLFMSSAQLLADANNMTLENVHLKAYVIKAAEAIEKIKRSSAKAPAEQNRPSDAKGPEDQNKPSDAE